MEKDAFFQSFELFEAGHERSARVQLLRQKDILPPVARRMERTETPGGAGEGLCGKVIDLSDQ